MEQQDLGRNGGEHESGAPRAADQRGKGLALLRGSPFLPVFELSHPTVFCVRRVEIGKLGHLYKVAESPLPSINKQMKPIFV